MTGFMETVAGFVDQPLSRRDWLLLPCVSLLTVLVMIAASEMVCRLAWPSYARGSCATTGGNLPNCVVRLKNEEGREYEYRFNDCGYRSGTSCRSKPPGTMRLVSMGTSISMGLYVSSQDLFANRAAKELSESLHRPVEAQNMGSLSITMDDIPVQIPQALALEPDAIVLEVCPYDLLTFADSGTPPPEANKQQKKPTVNWLHDAMQVRILLRESRSGYMAQHVLLSDDAFLYRTYADFGDADDGLSQPLSAACDRRYARLGKLFAEIREKLRGTKVPFFVLPTPNRIAAGMMSDHIHIPNRDPEAFERRVISMAAAAGLLTVSTSPYFEAVPHAERLYYTVDSHPGPGAHILFGHALAVRMADYFRGQSQTSVHGS